MSCHCRECGFGKKLNRTSFVVTKNDLEKIVKQINYYKKKFEESKALFVNLFNILERIS